MTTPEIDAALDHLEATRDIDAAAWKHILRELAAITSEQPFGTRIAVTYLKDVERHARRRKESVR